jgi:ribonucleotide monophosphatase NagD (HAD superfamily)
VTNNDLQYADVWHEPRLGPQAFTVCLKAMFTQLFRYDIECNLYGKPQNVAYEYAERAIQAKCQENGIEVTNFYMIGDNPLSDIDGGVKIGLQNEQVTGVNNWKTILVRSGVYREGDDTKGAHFIVDDMKAAYELILSQEGMI